MFFGLYYTRTKEETEINNISLFAEVISQDNNGLFEGVCTGFKVAVKKDSVFEKIEKVFSTELGQKDIPKANIKNYKKREIASGNPSNC